MIIDEITSNYILNDGQIISFKIDFSQEIISSASGILTLKVRKNEKSKIINDVILELEFTGLKQIDIVEEFDSGNYSDITFVRLENKDYYLSLDPFDNSNEPNVNDNFIIKSQAIKFTELK